MKRELARELLYGSLLKLSPTSSVHWLLVVTYWLLMLAIEFWVSLINIPKTVMPSSVVQKIIRISLGLFVLEWPEWGSTDGIRGQNLVLTIFGI